MRILAVAYDVPRPDQSSGELRFFTLLSLLAAGHEVSLFCLEQADAPGRVEALARLQRAGIATHAGTLTAALRGARFDLVLLEFYPVAREALDAVRAWQPEAKVVVDSVDVHFHRLRSKARLSGLSEDAAHAEAVRAKELDAYRRADMVLAVSDEDARILADEGLPVPVAVLPNIHAMHAPAARAPATPGRRLELVFVGSYKWAPNVDAMTWFCAEVMPLLRTADPALRVRLRIIGSSPTDAVRALAAADVEVVGFVDDTTPHLLDSDISIAPLRYGGGMKGKIGEALAHGLPVVTTAVGAEGFGFEIGRDILVAETAPDFATAIVALWRDPALYDGVRQRGWRFIDDRYSVRAVAGLLPPLLQRLQATPAQRLATPRRARIVASHHLRRLLRQESP